MAESLKIILHAKVHGDGTRAVMLRCIVTGHSGNRYKCRVICRVKDDQFDKKTGRVKKHPNYILYNARIANAFNQAEARLLTWQMQGKVIDPAAVIAPAPMAIHLESTLLAHVQQYVKACRLKGQSATAEKYEGHAARIAQYLGKRSDGVQVDIALDDVTEEWVLRWVGWLKENGTRSGNTLHRRMAFLKTMFNDARKRGLTSADPMAFLTFKEQAVRKTKLTFEQLAVLENLTLSGRPHHARNTFLLQFYCYGSRISDALTWKKADVYPQGEEVYLRYVSRKTGTPIEVRLNQKASALVSEYLDSVPGEYLLPWLADLRPRPDLSEADNESRLVKAISSKTAIVNGLLRLVADKAGLSGQLTTHIARHTFATLADSRIADKRKISAALGHTKFSTTEIYLSELRQDEVNDAMSVLWEPIDLSA